MMSFDELDLSLQDEVSSVSDGKEIQLASLAERLEYSIITAGLT